jgi:hypothetical protein
MEIHMKYSVLALTLALSMSASVVALAEEAPIVISVAANDAKPAEGAPQATNAPVVKQITAKAEHRSLSGDATRPKNLDLELRNR